MRVDVLNGVNLDVLERRDPELYGGLSLHELEQKIEAWAENIGHTVRCRQTNSEGRSSRSTCRIPRIAKRSGGTPP
jgi:3-dehydroquinate dehydratase-2